MSNLVAALDRHFYPTINDNWDDTALRERILQFLRPGDHMLDLGAGAGIVSQMNFRGIAARVCGLDPDPRVLQNPYLDEAKIGTGECIPFPNNTFHIVVADNVAEHLPTPEEVFFEVSRVLKPGGVFIMKTPNLFHYMPTIARFTPTGFHRFFNKLRGRAFQDTFPTQYRCNTSSALRRLARSSGLILESVEYIESRPEYLRIAVPLYMLGVLYERAVNTVPGLRGLRLVLIAKLRKPPPQSL
jgi:ubiquinone/menaquinone biosynthesis C-methylase UbiE